MEELNITYVEVYGTREVCAERLRLSKTGAVTARGFVSALAYSRLLADPLCHSRSTTSLFRGSIPHEVCARARVSLLTRSLNASSSKGAAKDNANESALRHVHTCR